jgi:pseudouridine kinase
MAEGSLAQPYVLVVGSASIDSKGRARVPFIPGSSIPGDVRISVGGVARNVADNLARLGVRSVLLSAVGGGGSGKRILSNAAEVGINTDYMIINPQFPTSAYIALLDEKGRLTMSVDDMRVLTSITPQVIDRCRNLIKSAAMVVMDSNLSQETIDTLIKVARRYKVHVAADPTSTVLAHRLKAHLRRIFMITPNVAEAEILSGIAIDKHSHAIAAARSLVNAGVEIVIITLAEAGVVYATASASGHVPAVATDVVDPTGGSDALTATVVFGLLNDIPIDEAVRLGASAAALTLATSDTVRSDLSLDLLYDQLLI